MPRLRRPAPAATRLPEKSDRTERERPENIVRASNTAEYSSE